METQSNLSCVRPTLPHLRSGNVRTLTLSWNEASSPEHRRLLEAIIGLSLQLQPVSYDSGGSKVGKAASQDRQVIVVK